MWPLEGYWNEGEVRTLFLGPCARITNETVSIRWCTGCEVGASLQPAIFGTVPRWSDHRQPPLCSSDWL